MKIIIASLVALSVTYAESFSSQHVVRCIVPTKEIEILQALEKEGTVDLWSVQPGDSSSVLADLRISRNQIVPFQCFDFISDIDSRISAESAPTFRDKNSIYPDEDEFFTRYNSFEQIVGKMREYIENYPHLATMKSFGKSVEGRDLWVLHLTNSKSTVENKKTIWLNGGQHAREWVGHASVMFVLDYLCKNSDKSVEVAEYLNNFEYVIAPLINPDGYEYSRIKGNRMWRKNRRRNSDGSYGVDLNRNWDEHWGLTGASSNPRSDIYMGPSVASEPEVYQTQNYVLTLKNRKAGIDFHAYGQLILRSWGWTTKLSENEVYLKKVGDSLRDAISGAQYTSQRAAQLYPTGGSTDDWFTSKAGMLGFTVELRDTGKHGFILPPEYIIPTGQDAVAIVLKMSNILLNE